MPLQPSTGIQLGAWRLERPLGRGRFGVTWQARGPDGQDVAIKLVDRVDADEVRALTRLCHAAIVELIEVGHAPVAHLVMRLAQGLPVDRHPAIPLSDAPLLAVAAQLADALDAIHRVGVVHGDLSAANVVLDDPTLPTLRIVDFGASAGRGGTHAFAAPERLSGGPPRPESDVFSLGVLLWFLAAGKLPWGDAPEASAARRQTALPALPRGPRWLSSLLTAATDPSPALRPTASHIAERLLDHGAHLQPPDVGQIAARADATYVRRARVDLAIDDWLDTGGTLFLRGSQGSGRQHAARRVAHELTARAAPWARLATGADAAAFVAVLRTWYADAAPELLDRPAALADLLQAHLPPGAVLVVHDHDGLSAPLQSAVAALAQSGGLAVCATGRHAPGWAGRTVDLHPFSRAAAEEFGRRVLGDGDVSGLIDALWDQTAGSPGALRDGLLQLVERGGLVWLGRRWSIDPLVGPGLPAPRTPHVALDADPDAHLLASALAAHARPTRPALVARVLGWSPGRVLLTAERLRAAGALDQDTEHLHWRDPSVLRGLPADAVDALHHAWLRVLLSLDPIPAESLVAHLPTATDPVVLTRHGPAAITACLGRDPLQALELARTLCARCSDDTLALMLLRALMEAVRHEELLSTALAVAERTQDEEVRATALAWRVRVLAQVRPHGEEADAALALALGTPARSQGRRALGIAHVQLLAARRAYVAALALAESHCGGPPPAEPEAREDWARLRTLWAQILLETQGSEAAMEALSALGEDLALSASMRAIVHSVRGRVLLHAGRLLEAQTALLQALEPGSGLTLIDRARTLNNAAILTFQTGARGAAVDHWERALVLFERVNLPWEQLRTQVNLCIGYREAGRPTRAELAGRWAVAMAQELGAPQLEAQAAGSLCDLHLASEALDVASSWYEHALGLAVAHDLLQERMELARRRAEIAALREEPDAAARAEHAVSLATSHGNPLQLARALAVRALGHARAREPEQAVSALTRALETATEAGATSDVAEIRLWAATAHLALGHAEEAQDEVARIDAFAAEVGHLDLRRRAARLAAQAATLRSQVHPRHEADRLPALTLELHQLQDVGEILRRITGAMVELADIDRAFVFVGPELRQIAGSARPDAPTDAPPRSLLGRCLALRAEVVVADVTERGELREATSVVNLQLQAALCVPLTRGAEVIGILYADSCRAPGEELRATLGYVRALASHAAVAIARADDARELQRELAERRRLSHAKDELIASISHELRTPLQAILGHATELLRAAPSAREDRPLEQILAAGRRLLTTIDDILAYASPVEEGREPTSFQLRALIEEVTARHAAAAAAKGLAWRLHLDTQADQVVLGRQDLLRDILNRLLDNAVKFTETGSVTLTVVPLHDPPGTWEIAVRDTGPGLDTQDGRDLTAAFVLGADATTRSREGAGLGLALCRRNAAQLGARLTLTTPHSGGTRVTFCPHLPPKPGTRPRSALLEQLPQRVLVVDDNPVNRFVLSRIVEAVGLPCDVATGGEQAVERASETCYLAVLMDCHMPGMDGLQATRHIRQLPVPNRWTPVFAVTADGRADYRERCLEAGMDLHVVKPVERDQVSALLRSAAACWRGDTATEAAEMPRQAEG